MTLVSLIDCGNEATEEMQLLVTNPKLFRNSFFFLFSLYHHYSRSYSTITCRKLVEQLGKRIAIIMYHYCYFCCLKFIWPVFAFTKAKCPRACVRACVCVCVCVGIRGALNGLKKYIHVWRKRITWQLWVHVARNSLNSLVNKTCHQTG